MSTQVMFYNISISKNEGGRKYNILKSNWNLFGKTFQYKRVPYGYQYFRQQVWLVSIWYKFIVKSIFEETN